MIDDKNTAWNKNNKIEMSPDFGDGTCVFHRLNIQ